MGDSRQVVTVLACCVVSTVLGSIHAFSVFLPEWENLPGADRAGVSLIYSLALVSLTAAVLVGYRLFRRLTPSALFLCVGVVASLGLVLSARSASLMALYLSYGVVFGAANGIGYGYALQLSGQAAPERRGLAMSLVTAFYAVGATVAPVVFTALIEAGGNALALMSAALVVCGVSFAAALLVGWSGAAFVSESASSVQSLSSHLARSRTVLWAAYGCAVLAGLMVIGHAFSMAQWLGLDGRLAAWATTAVAFGNMLGGFSAGYASDRLSSRVLLAALPVGTAVGLLLLASPLGVVFIALGVVGYCYGAIIAVYPVAVSDVFGSLSAPRLYGQIFTAWGFAGLVGPWSSGWLFDQTGSYTLSLYIAMALSVLSVVCIRVFLPHNAPVSP